MKREKIYQLHKNLASGKYKEKILEICWNHSLIVEEIALNIATDLEKKYEIKIDKELLSLGALVHDLGYYKCFDESYKLKVKYITHGQLGYDFLKKFGFAEKVARFAISHTGVGIDKEQIEKENLPLEKHDYIPISLEEEIIAYVDNFHSKGHPGFNSFEETKNELNNINSSYGIILERFKKKFGVPDVTELKIKYKIWHEEINEWLKKSLSANAASPFEKGR
ncbi:MAG: HD domain-containing protein [Candidatus Shapirobacteria bacterium]|nr:HD domain-containing protein [Candidatus Shapirobacteria bacterium]